MNKSNIGASTNFLQILLDIAISAVAFIFSVVTVGAGQDYMLMKKFFVIYMVFMFLYVLTNKDSRVYNVTTFFYMDRIFKNVTKSFVVSAVVVATLLSGMEFTAEFNFFSTFLMYAYFMLLVGTFVFRYVHKEKMSKFFPRTAYIGEMRQFDKFDSFMKKTNIGINFLGYIRVDKQANSRYLGNIEELETIIRDYSIDQVYIMQSKTGKTDMQDYIDLCMEMGVTVRMVMDFYQERYAKSYMSSVGTYPIVTYHTVSLNNAEKVLKRTVDILGSLVGIIIFSPIMLVSAVLIKLTSEGPIIFKQKRIGMNGRIFYIYKFRTMVTDAEALKVKLLEQNEVEGNLMFKMKDDPRITKIGKLLRKTSIDELPQFFNVFLGSMSLVGTRPPTEDEVRMYQTHHWRRISIRPGITGMWQVSGRSSITSFDEIVELDTKYIDEWSILMDFKVILKTVEVLFKREGAY